EPPHQRGAVAAAGDEARPDAHIALAEQHRLEQWVEVGGVVLAVGVELDADVVAALGRVPEPGLERPADTQVYRVAHDRDTGLARDSRPAIVRAVVHDQRVEAVGRAARPGGDTRAP